MFHGPVKEAVPFFEKLGFICPERKDHASFLQEVTTAKGEPSAFMRHRRRQCLIAHIRATWRGVTR